MTLAPSGGTRRAWRSGVGILFFYRLDHAHLLGRSEPAACTDAFMAEALHGAAGAAVTCVFLLLLPKNMSSAQLN
jgi:hypothetical protein